MTKIAFIDIGTNSVRYLAVSISSSGNTEILRRGLAAPRLGEGFSITGRLRKEAINRTLEALEKIKNDLGKVGMKKFRCVGTEALRSAANASDFITPAQELGLEVSVLSGKREAELIYFGAIHDLPRSGSGTILIDVGGGSAEIIIKTRESEKPLFRSLNLGCVRLREQFEGESRPEPVVWEEMRKFSSRFLKTHGPKILTQLPAVGLGGTFTTLASIHLKLPAYQGEKVHGLLLSQKDIGNISRKIKCISLEERKKIPGLEPERADIIIPGIIIVQAIMEYTGAEEVTISDRGLLFGLLQQFLSQ